MGFAAALAGFSRVLAALSEGFATFGVGEGFVAAGDFGFFVPSCFAVPAFLLEGLWAALAVELFAVEAFAAGLFAAELFGAEFAEAFFIGAFGDTVWAVFWAALAADRGVDEADADFRAACPADGFFLLVATCPPTRTRVSPEIRLRIAFLTRGVKRGASRPRRVRSLVDEGLTVFAELVVFETGGLQRFAVGPIAPHDEGPAANDIVVVPHDDRDDVGAAV